MNEKPSTAAPIIVAILLLLPLLYVGSYLLLVEQGTMFGSGRGPWSIPDDYRVGGEVAKWVFYPLNQLDRRLRPAHWQYGDPVILLLDS
jgi:hypothetical protein